MAALALDYVNPFALPLLLCLLLRCGCVYRHSWPAAEVVAVLAAKAATVVVVVVVVVVVMVAVVAVRLECLAQSPPSWLLQLC